MPYIKQEARAELRGAIKRMLDDLEAGRGPVPGEINYVISSIIWHIFDAEPCYNTANALLGVLEGVKLEFYRRKVAPYEDEKIKENGDL